MLVGTGVLDDSGRVYNSAVSMGANGELAGRYDKRRLFPVGEYAFAPSLFSDMASRAASFTEGRLRDPLTLHGRPVAVTICHEGLWPGLVREGVRAQDAELLVNLTNDIRFGDTSEPWAHFYMTKLRAIEHRRYLVRVANSGISAVVDPAGRVMAATRPFRAEAVVEDVFLMSGHTLYGRIGDIPWYAVSVACFYMALVRRRPPGEGGGALAA